MLTEKPAARTTVPSERDKERDHELEQRTEISMRLAQLSESELTDRDD